MDLDFFLPDDFFFFILGLFELLELLDFDLESFEYFVKGLNSLIGDMPL
jgi:hypothetical protein